ncbi:MAG: DEAD/DEAH box helicase [Granulosicoccus sp.]|nr:DEAD/DEAH box helicase [Granulosicoccus sp.]
MSFNALVSSPGLLRILDELGFCEPTPVQRELYALVKTGQDVLVTAGTGSGKTLAYLLPLLDRIAHEATRSRCRVLVIMPTRELVRQVARVIESLMPALNACKLVQLAGGSSINPQLLALRGGADILLATPGRLLDVIEHNGIDTSGIDVLVLDEADSLLGDGFHELIADLTSRLQSCQRLMISATYTRKVRARAGRLLTEPVCLDMAAAHGQISHRAILVDEQSRAELLIELVSRQLPLPLLIFTADRRGADRLARTLAKASINAGALHSKLSMLQRASVLERLAQGELQALVATDLAARGIDIPMLPHVVNYDLPRSVDMYTHRIGRTARAGLPGTAISLVDINAEAHLCVIEKRLGITVCRERIAGFEPHNQLRPVLPGHDGNGGIKGRRMSRKDRLRAATSAQSRNADDLAS